MANQKSFFKKLKKNNNDAPSRRYKNPNIQPSVFLAKMRGHVVHGWPIYCNIINFYVIFPGLW